jgi:hypothetical protein
MKKQSPGAETSALRRSVTIAGGVVFVLLVGFFLYADFRFGPNRAAAWFGGISVVVSGLALTAAITAVWLALPGYVEWQREQSRSPSIRIQVEVGPANAPTPADNQALVEVPTATDQIEVACVSQAEVFVRVAVINVGSGPLRNGIVNICVPATSPSCDFEAFEGAHTSLRRMPWTALNGEICPGEVVRVRALVAEAEFAPGIRMLHFRMWLPSGEPTPLLVVVAGDPLPAVVRRVLVKATVQP